MTQVLKFQSHFQIDRSTERGIWGWTNSVWETRGKARLPRFKPKCPAFGSVLKKAQNGYLCQNYKCNVIQVCFNRHFKVVKIVHEGFAGIAFDRKKK